MPDRRSRDHLVTLARACFLAALCGATSAAADKAAAPPVFECQSCTARHKALQLLQAERTGKVEPTAPAQAGDAGAGTAPPPAEKPPVITE